MHHTTEAIVLQHYPYKDNGAVVKLYSRHQGIISCWAQSIHKKTSKTKVNLLQPLTIVKAEINDKENNSLIQLKELEVAVHTPAIALHIEKSTIAIFLSELLLKLLKESVSDESLYLFIRDAIVLLDSTTEKCANFHIVFIIALSNHLGLLPNANHTAETSYFNLKDGIYQNQMPMHPHFLNPAESEWLSKLSEYEMEDFYKPVIPAASRKLLLRGLLEYFELHLAITPLKSHLVLEEVF
jgi:DNA repair protein RecO (recombination protein O)